MTEISFDLECYPQREGVLPQYQEQHTLLGYRLKAEQETSLFAFFQDHAIDHGRSALASCLLTPERFRQLYASDLETLDVLSLLKLREEIQQVNDPRFQVPLPSKAQLLASMQRLGIDPQDLMQEGKPLFKKLEAEGLLSAQQVSRLEEVIAGYASGVEKASSLRREGEIEVLMRTTGRMIQAVWTHFWRYLTDDTFSDEERLAFSERMQRYTDGVDRILEAKHTVVEAQEELYSLTQRNIDHVLKGQSILPMQKGIETVEKAISTYHAMLKGHKNFIDEKIEEGKETAKFLSVASQNGIGLSDIYRSLNIGYDTSQDEAMQRVRKIKEDIEKNPLLYSVRTRTYFKKVEKAIQDPALYLSLKVQSYQGVKRLLGETPSLAELLKGWTLTPEKGTQIAKELEKSRREAQRLLHPDKHTGKGYSADEQEYLKEALQWVTHLSEAFRAGSETVYA